MTYLYSLSTGNRPMSPVWPLTLPFPLTDNQLSYSTRLFNNWPILLLRQLRGYQLELSGLTARINFMPLKLPQFKLFFQWIKIQFRSIAKSISFSFCTLFSCVTGSKISIHFLNANYSIVCFIYCVVLYISNIAF